MRNDLNTLTHVYEYLGELVDFADGKMCIGSNEGDQHKHDFWSGVKAGLELAKDKIDIMRQVEENR